MVINDRKKRVKIFRKGQSVPVTLYRFRKRATGVRKHMNVPDLTMKSCLKIEIQGHVYMHTELA